MDEENIMHTYLPGVKHPQLLAPCSPIFLTKVWSVTYQSSRDVLLLSNANSKMQFYLA